MLHYHWDKCDVTMLLSEMIFGAMVNTHEIFLKHRDWRNDLVFDFIFAVMLYSKVVLLCSLTI